MNFIGRLHSDYAYSRRVRVLSNLLTDLMPQNAQVLDVGCGDGLIAYLLMQKRLDLRIRGIDVLGRGQTYIPIEGFDGRVIPCVDKGLDVVMFVDVLHHTENPVILLREAMRVARKAIVIKDHTCNGLFAGPTLRFMDWVGNARYGISLPYNYWPQQKWLEAFDMLGLTIGVWKRDLNLYSRPASWVFDRSLHFLTQLEVRRKLSDHATCINR